MAPLTSIMTLVEALVESVMLFIATDPACLLSWSLAVILADLMILLPQPSWRAPGSSSLCLFGAVPG
jgi:hypothetical protein